MIAAIIELDHDAGRELLANVGNAPQPAWDRRGGGMRDFADLWDVHGTILEQAVFPRLTKAAGRNDLVETLRIQHRQVADMALELARRAANHDADGRWLTDFAELKSRFDAQCLREMTELIPLIRDKVPPPEVAEMTRQARALRQTRPE